jgi:hypothetical protein
MQHHAYIYEGSQDLLGELADNARVYFGFEASPPAGGNPDVHIEQWEKFGIDDSQKLKETAGLRSVSGRELFVLGIASITSEAQQALLKLFEEPQEGSIFVLLMPHGTLLPTLRSRIMKYPEKLQIEKLKLPVQKVLGSPVSRLARPLGPDSFAQQASVFLSSTQKDRSDWIIKFLKDEDSQKERVREFLQELEIELAKKIKNKEARAGLEDIAKVRSYVADRSPSLKMLLEHLAVTLPTV